jgi:hypothetical protein
MTRLFQNAYRVRQEKARKEHTRRMAWRRAIDITIPTLVMIVGVIFLFAIFSCSAPVSLDNQKLVHNNHVLGGNFYKDCMFCQGEINFLLGHSTTTTPWEDKVFRY